MCNSIIINLGEKEIATPREFLEHFGFVPYDVEAVLMDECLCYCDLEKTLNEHKIPFKNDCGDLYVGMLEKIKWT
jgi:hypothetical protein